MSDKILIYFYKSSDTGLTYLIDDTLLPIPTQSSQSSRSNFFLSSLTRNRRVGGTRVLSFIDMTTQTSF